MLLQGARLKLCTADRQGLLAEVTRIFRENGLNVTKAKISTTKDTARNTFYVTNANGNPIDQKTIEAVRQRIGLKNLEVEEWPMIDHKKVEREETTTGVAEAVLFSLGSLVRWNLYHLGLIKSHS